MPLDLNILTNPNLLIQMAATLAVERPKSSFERPDSNIRATRLMREKLTTDFMTEFKYVATQALSLDTAEHKVSEKRSPEALSMALVNSCWGDNGFVNLERAEGILLKIHDTLT